MSGYSKNLEQDTIQALFLLGQLKKREKMKERL